MPRATAAPMPRLAPVTRQTLPVISNTFMPYLLTQTVLQARSSPFLASVIAVEAGTAAQPREKAVAAPTAGYARRPRSLPVLIPRYDRPSLHRARACGRDRSCLEPSSSKHGCT